jgi:NhaA family Na+:H+ antiporter
MSLFISNVAFNSPDALEQAKIGILAASLISGSIGLAWLRLAGPVRRTGKRARESVLSNQKPETGN